MRWKPVLLSALCAVGCSSSSGGSGRDDAAGSSSTFQLTGTVTNPFSTLQAGRLVVGVARSADVAQTINCDRFLAHMDHPAQTLPADYELAGIPEGSYVLVGLVIDSAETRAPAGVYSIMVDAEGVHAGSQITVTKLNIACQGTMSYQCP